MLSSLSTLSTQGADASHRYTTSVDANHWSNLYNCYRHTVSTRNKVHSIFTKPSLTYWSSICWPISGFFVRHLDTLFSLNQDPRSAIHDKHVAEVGLLQQRAQKRGPVLPIGISTQFGWRMGRREGQAAKWSENSPSIGQVWEQKQSQRFLLLLVHAMTWEGVRIVDTKGNGTLPGPGCNGDGTCDMNSFSPIPSPSLCARQLRKSFS